MTRRLSEQKVDYQPTQLVILAELTLTQACEVAAAIGGMVRGHQWWAGDLLVHAEEHYGEAFAQVEAELGIEPQTGMNWRYVAKQVELSRRREDLSWSHHAEVARLGSKAQTSCLAKAVKEAWSVRQLRDHVALTYPQSGEEPLFRDEPTPRDDEALQKRIEEIERSLERDETLADHWRTDVAWLVHELKRRTRGG